jgi:hypothetical protein
MSVSIVVIHVLAWHRHLPRIFTEIEWATGSPDDQAKQQVPGRSIFEFDLADLSNNPDWRLWRNRHTLCFVRSNSHKREREVKCKTKGTV